MRLFDNAAVHSSRIAIVSNNSSYSYKELLEVSETIAENLLGSKTDLQEARIAFLVSPSFEYAAVQWAIWRAGAVAVPLCVLHPLPSMKYVVDDAGVEIIIADEENEVLAKALSDQSGLPLFLYTELLIKTPSILPEISTGRNAMILYTSGTTNNPKGVVSTHNHVEAQITTLIKAWEWEENDRILNVLPLHHVHGIINVMLCALWAGATCEFLPKFEAEKVWERISSGEFTLFMGVPTMYYQLIKYWDSSPDQEQKRLSRQASGLRLMVSGSAALPVPVMEKWEAITGHTLLERYGMTEIGMGLSNPYHGKRRPGHVGLPLEGVLLKLVDEDLNEVAEGEAGEIIIKGPSVFKEYWNKPDATAKAFTEYGWFLTGDIAVLEEGSYKILGRNSVDIIKSGGYKISALEIEAVMRNHPEITDCAVVGLPDEEWGEVVASALVIQGNTIDLELLSIWLKDRLPSYKIPRKYTLLDQLPRNVLGKVTKAAVKQLFSSSKESQG